MNYYDIRLVKYMMNTAELLSRPFPHDSHYTGLCIDVLASTNSRLYTPTKSREFAVLGRIVQNITISHQLFKYRNVRNRDRLHLERAYIVRRTRWDGIPSMRVKFSAVRNGGKRESLLMLLNLFREQLPNMPRQYVSRLVLDRKNKS